MIEFDLDRLREFELGLDARHPEHSRHPPRILGYGEISAVLSIPGVSSQALAFKRLPMFHDEAEAEQFEALYDEYLHILQEEIGLALVPSQLVRLAFPELGRVVVYIVQEQFPAEAIGNRAIGALSRGEITQLVRTALSETRKAFLFNRRHQDKLEIGLDGQISNWAIVDFDRRNPDAEVPPCLAYFDTTTPFIRKDGVEQANPELFLRAAPSFMLWIIRLLFLEDVMTRYYDHRKVAIDLAANFYKEGRPELIPEVVELANETYAGGLEGEGFQPITTEEVRAYYRQDALTWRVYLSFRKIDRALSRLRGRVYPYILPEKVRR